MSDTVLTIHIDGAARGNPGPAAFAFLIERNGTPAIEEKGYLGTTTNNVAEYTALVRALEHALQLGGKRLRIHSDSELLVKQMNGAYRVRHPDLQQLHRQASALRQHFDLVTIDHVRRENNRRADALCNEALDAALAKSPRPTRTRARSPGPREQAIDEEAVLCLRSAAQSWTRGNANDPPPEAVWDLLRSILEENGVLAPRRAT
jgi:ribonuclease HI